MRTFPPTSSPSVDKRFLPQIAAGIAVIAAALTLTAMGRALWCSCGSAIPWSWDVWSKHNSQHVIDPYSFTHVLHGFVFYGALALVVPRLTAIWRLTLAVCIEAVWEVVENSEFVVQRYREGTAALGYTGDTVVNSLSDIVLCGFGFALAYRLGFRRTVAVFVVIEVLLAVWIRDNLSLNILMLIYPIDAIKEWQAAGHSA